MKKTTKKLQLTTESVRVLTKDELANVAGGWPRGTESKGVSCTCPDNGCHFDPSYNGCLG